MHLMVSSGARRKAWHGWVVALSIFSLATLAHSSPAPQSALDVPYLGLYIILDNRFYYAGTDDDALSFDSIEGDWAFVVYPAVMSACNSLGGSPLGDSHTLFVYGLSDPALPIVSAIYQSYADANGSVAVLNMRSIPGDVACTDQLSLIPVQYDHIYSDGFGGSM